VDDGELRVVAILYHHQNINLTRLVAMIFKAYVPVDGAKFKTSWKKREI